METSELLKKVRLIELKTRGMSNQIFSGEYHSAFKGRGMAFSEVREYSPGDEIRTIDWNVTARSGAAYVKIYEEERELTVMLVVDISKSESYGTKSSLKKEIITEICAVLSFSAIQNNDKVGVIFFSDKIEKFIPPKKGKSHILRIIRELINFVPDSSGTNINNALVFFNNVIKKRSITFLISDFYDKGFEKSLSVIAKRHDVIGLHIQDKSELELMDIGFVPFQNLETKENFWINTSSKKTREVYKDFFNNHTKYLNSIFRKSGIDKTSIYTDESYVKPLMNLFKKRELKK